MATFYLPSSGGYSTTNEYIKYRIVVTEGTLSGRTIPITVSVQFYRTNDYTTNRNGTCYCSINGTEYSQSFTSTTMSISLNSYTELFSKTVNITYDDDGNAVVPIYASWQTETSASGNEAYSSDSQGGDVTLTSIAPNSYTISYNANGGSGAPSSQTVTPGSELTLSSTIPTKSGYDFVGWSTSSSATSASYYAGNSYTFTSSTTLYAVWKISTYIISYSANGGINAPSSQTKTHGVTLTLTSETPTRTGYTFLGWGTSSTSTSVAYAPGATYTTNAELILYAIWKANTYTLILNYNDGSTSNKTLTLTYDSTNYNDLSDYIFNRAGYKFIGWYSSVSDGDVVYRSDGTCVNNGVYWNNDVCVHAGNYTVYAHWKALNVAYYKIDGEYKLCYTYIKVDGTWKKAVMYKKLNGSYYPNDKSIRIYNNGILEAANFIEANNVDNPYIENEVVYAESFIEHTEETIYFKDGVMYAKEFIEK